MMNLNEEGDDVMPSIPMICSECSSVFEGPIYIEDSTVDVRGITVTCPNCLRNVIPDNGKYEHMNGVLRVIDSVDDDFINEAIGIFLSDMTNELKLKNIERLFKQKRGQNLEDVADRKYKGMTFKEKLLVIWTTITFSKEFVENYEFVERIIKSIKNSF